MHSTIRNYSLAGLSTLGLLAACFSPSSISANGDSGRHACYHNWRNGLNFEHCWHKKGLSFEITALLFNLSPTLTPITGVAEARIFSPEGKETFLGRIEFSSLGFLDFTPLIFDWKHARGSKSSGEYHAVIDIFCEEGGPDLLSVNLIGSVSVFKQSYEFIRGIETAVSFIDLDFNTTAHNFQINTSFYNHHRKAWQQPQ